MKRSRLIPSRRRSDLITMIDEFCVATSPRRVLRTLQPSDTQASASLTAAGPGAQEQGSPSAAYLKNTNYTLNTD
jgi:hypothetical protein